jgi:hypothetical protein
MNFALRLETALPVEKVTGDLREVGVGGIEWRMEHWGKLIRRRKLVELPGDCFADGEWRKRPGIDRGMKPGGTVGELVGPGRFSGGG